MATFFAFFVFSFCMYSDTTYFSLYLLLRKYVLLLYNGPNLNNPFVTSILHCDKMYNFINLKIVGSCQDLDFMACETEKHFQIWQIVKPKMSLMKRG